MAKPNKDQSEYLLVAPCTGTTKSTRLSLTTSSVASTRVVVGAKYFLRLSAGSSGAAFCSAAASTALPASDAAETAGFWIDAGETVRFDSSAAVFSAIMTAGTGELLITRVDL